MFLAIERIGISLWRHILDIRYCRIMSVDESTLKFNWIIVVYDF
jgi:hypothetical protein